MNYLKSPMNYIGNKYRVLDQIVPLLPSANHYVDLFAGGLDVAINNKSSVIYCNDINYYLIDIYKSFQQVSFEDLLEQIDTTIGRYGLSKTNIDGYMKFREHYNNSERDPIELYILMNFGFNYQLRFNSQHEFNNSFGKNRSCFNQAIRTRLQPFTERIKNYHFSSVDFRKFDFSILQKGDLLYCDPPYTISVGSYNDGKRGFNGWQQQDDIDLMKLLDELSNRGVRFALSNILSHKGIDNEALAEWATQYTVHDIDCNYNNSSYHLTKKSDTREVLITNE